jgi:hypothetical protein
VTGIGILTLGRHIVDMRPDECPNTCGARLGSCGLGQSEERKTNGRTLLSA